MARYECVEGSAKKFWEIEVEGRSVTVRFGRLGTEGQRKTKRLASAETAVRERDRLVREKTQKGYRLVGSEARPASAAPVRATATKAARPAEGASGLAALEAFVAALRAHAPRNELPYVEELRAKPMKASDVKAYAQRWGARPPDDVIAFWAREVPNLSLVDAKGIASGSLSLLQPPVGAALASLRKIFTDEARVHADQLRDGPYQSAGMARRGELYTDGMPLNDGDNPLVWDSKRGGVWQTAGEPSDVPTEPIAESFDAFLLHFVASGAFACGTADRARFAAHWKVAEKLVPVRIPVEKNRWLQHLSRFYPSPKAIFPSKKRR